MRRYSVLFFILLFVFFLRIPSLFEPYWYGDEGIRLAVGQALFSGKIPYRDVFDNAPPLLYVLFGAGGTLFGVKLILTLWILGATAIFYLLAKSIERSFNLKSKLFPPLATFLFVLATSTPLFEGNLANGEIFFILPSVAAMFLVFEALMGSASFSAFFLLGTLFALSSLTKVPSVTDFLAAIIVFIFFLPKKSLVKNLSFSISGFLIPWIITFISFSMTGNFSFFFESVFTTGISYINFANQLITPFGALILKIITASFFALILFVNKKHLGAQITFLFLWLSFSLLGALIGGRGFTHYLIQAMAPLTLILALPTLRLTRGQIVSAFFGLVIFSFVFYIGGFTLKRSFSYYENFIRYAWKLKTTEEYQGWFDAKTPSRYAIAEFLQTKLQKGKCIFIFGDEPQLYPLSGFCPQTRFIAAYHLNFDPNFREEAIKKLESDLPSLIVVFDETQTSFPQFNQLLIFQYRPLYRISDAVIWQKRSQLLYINQLSLRSPDTCRWQAQEARHGICRTSRADINQQPA